MEEVLGHINIAFTALFALEMVLKITGLGFIKYLGDTWNLFDFLVVGVSLLELALTTGSAMTALRYEPACLHGSSTCNRTNNFGV